MRRKRVAGERKKASAVVAVTAMLLVLLCGCSFQDNLNKKRILEYMENKYGVEFKILGARSDGRKGNSSYNIMSPEYPHTVTSVDIFRAGTPSEKIIEDYGYICFRDQWERYYAHRIKDFFGEGAYMVYGFCIPKEELDALFQGDKVDLNTLSFEKLGESGGGMLAGVDFRILIIQDMPDENYDPIYEEVLAWFKHLRGLGFERAGIQILGFAEHSLNVPEVAAEKKAVDELNGYGAGDLLDVIMDPDIKSPNRFIFGHGTQVTFEDLSKIETTEDLKEKLHITKIE